VHAAGVFVSAASRNHKQIISAPKPLNQLISPDSEMRCDITKNSSQCSHFERVVIGNRDVMPTTLARSQS
jgi:hypothetical protein